MDRLKTLLKAAGLSETTGANLAKLLRNEYYRHQDKKTRESKKLPKPKKH